VKKSILIDILILVLFIILSQYKKYNVLIFGFLAIALLIWATKVLRYYYSKKVFKKVKTILMKTENYPFSEYENIVLILKDCNSEKEYKIHQNVIFKPKIGKVYYILVNENDENDYFYDNLINYKMRILICYIGIILIAYFLYIHVKTNHLELLSLLSEVFRNTQK
jgi:hypothetical protein